jgi:uncharacterized protein YqfB (UPF0267 family)
MACGCDAILFSQIGELGPLDVQLSGKNQKFPISGITINRLVEQELKGKNTNEYMREWIYKTLKPEEVLELKRFNDVAAKYLEELLPNRMFKENSMTLDEIKKIIEKICLEFPNHSFVIDYATAKNELNLNALQATPQEEILLQNIRELWDLGARLNSLNFLNSENYLLKRLLKDQIGGKAHD